MKLTVDFQETLKKRIRTDKAFRRELLFTAIYELMKGHLKIARTLFNDFFQEKNKSCSKWIQ